MSGLLSCEAIGGLVSSGFLPWRDSGYPCITRDETDPSNPDQATGQTIRRMAELSGESIGTRRLHHFARKSAVTWRGGPNYAGRAVNWDDQLQLACSVWYGVNSRMKFREHSEQILALLNERDQLQLLISPDELVKQSRPSGDCAVYTPFVCAALGTLGIHYEFVTLACDPREPDLYTHVYARAVFRDGSRLPMDASHGKYPGWEVSTEHQIRKQVWNEAGQPVTDEAPRRLVPLGQYRRVRRVMPRHIVGMGQVAADGSVDMTGGSTLSPADIAALSAANQAYFNPPSVSTPPTFPTAAPSAPPGFNWDAWLGQFLNQGVALAGKVVAPTTTIVRGPGGQLFYQTPAGSQTPLTAGTLLTSGGSNWLLIGGALLAGVVLLSALKGR